MGCWEGVDELVTELLILDTVCLELGAENRFGGKDGLVSSAKRGLFASSKCGQEVKS